MQASEEKDQGPSPQLVECPSPTVEDARVKASPAQPRDEREKQSSFLSSQFVGSSGTLAKDPREPTVAPSDGDSVHAMSSPKEPVHGAGRKDDKSENLPCAVSRGSQGTATLGSKAATENARGSSPPVQGQVHGQPPTDLGLSKRKRYREATRDLLAQLEMKIRSIGGSRGRRRSKNETMADCINAVRAVLDKKEDFHGGGGSAGNPGSETTGYEEILSLPQSCFGIAILRPNGIVARMNTALHQLFPPIHAPDKYCYIMHAPTAAWMRSETGTMVCEVRRNQISFSVAPRPAFWQPVSASELRTVIVFLTPFSAPTADDTPSSTTLAAAGLASGPASAVVSPSLADVARSAASLPAGAPNQQLNMLLNANLGVRHPDALPPRATSQYGNLAWGMSQFSAMQEAARHSQVQLNTASSALGTAGMPFLPLESRLNLNTSGGANINNMAGWQTTGGLSADEIASSDPVLRALANTMDSNSLLALADRIQLMNAQAIRQKVEGRGAADAHHTLNLFDLGRDAPSANGRNQTAGDNSENPLKEWHQRQQESLGLSGLSGAGDFKKILGEPGPSGTSEVQSTSGGGGAIPAGTSDWKSILGGSGHAGAVDGAQGRAVDFKSMLTTPPNLPLPLLGGSQGLPGITLQGVDTQAIAAATDADSNMSSALNSMSATIQAPDFNSNVSSALNSMSATNQAPDFKASTAPNSVPSQVGDKPQEAANPNLLTPDVLGRYIQMLYQQQQNSGQ